MMPRHRLLAAALLAALTLPSPVFALRAGLEGRESEVSRALSTRPVPAAGAEEVDPMVREVIGVFVARPDTAELAKHLGSFTTAQQRLQFFQGLVWFADRPEVPAIVRDAFIPHDDATQAIRTQLFTWLGEDTSMQGVLALRMILGKLSFADAKQVAEVAGHLSADSRQPHLKGAWGTAAFALLDSGIREERERIEQEGPADPEPLHTLVELYRQQGELYGQQARPVFHTLAGIAKGFANMYALTLVGRGQASAVGNLQQHRAAAQRTFEKVRSTLQGIRATPIREPITRWFIDQLLHQWIQTYADFLAEFDVSSSAAIRALRDEARVLENEMSATVRQWQQAYSAAGLEEPAREFVSVGAFQETLRTPGTTIMTSESSRLLEASARGAQRVIDLPVPIPQGPESVVVYVDATEWQEEIRDHLEIEGWTQALAGPSPTFQVERYPADPHQVPNLAVGIRPIGAGPYPNIPTVTLKRAEEILQMRAVDLYAIALHRAIIGANCSILDVISYTLKGQKHLVLLIKPQDDAPLKESA